MDLAERRTAGATGSTVGLRMKSFPAISYYSPAFFTYFKNVGVSINKSEGTVRPLIKAISAVFRGERPRC